MKLWKTKNITAVEAMKRLGVTKTLFYKWAKEIRYRGGVMTEQQYKDLLIATAKMSEYEYKDEVIEALKVASVSFQKEWGFTYHLPNHRKL